MSPKPGRKSEQILSLGLYTGTYTHRGVLLHPRSGPAGFHGLPAPHPHQLPCYLVPWCCPLLPKIPPSPDRIPVETSTDSAHDLRAGERRGLEKLKTLDGSVQDSNISTYSFLFVSKLCQPLLLTLSLKGIGHSPINVVRSGD